MQIEQTEIAAIIRQLEWAKGKGNNWVVFNDHKNHEPHWLRYSYFSSSAEAEAKCSDRNYPADYYEQPDYGEIIGFDDEPAYYCFMAIDDMQQLLQPAALNHKELEMPVNTIVELMNDQSVHLLTGGRYDQLLVTLQKEEFFPVEWIKQVIPEQEVAQYHVVEHQHNGGQVYEIGHRHRVLESFQTFEQAHQYMEHCVNLSGTSNENSDYLLIGQYHNKPCKLEMEGDPEPNCGLTFLTAYTQYNTEIKAREYVWHQAHSLERPVNLRQYMFAKYNTADGKLQLYNDRLQPADPNNYQSSVYPSHFNNDPITIKNSIIMNTQNLDYLKESLKYAGFNTHLNAELEKHIEAQSPDFQLNHKTKIGEDDMEYALHFRKGDKNEMYFFNKMDATLTKPGENEQGISQSFYANQHISAKEAYNLLDGRAVETKLSYKDDIKKTYDAWVQLDFSKKDKNNNYEVEKFTEKYGFKVDDKLKELSLKEHENTKDVDLMLKSLKRGNITEATWDNKGMSEKIYLTANPKEWTLNAYDANMNKLETKDMKLNAKTKEEGVADDISGDAKKNRRQEQRNDEPAKRQSRKAKI